MNTIFKRELWTNEFIQNSAEYLGIINSKSGIVVQDPRITKLTQAADAGTRIEIPFVQESTYSGLNISDFSETDGTITDISKLRSFAWVGHFNKIYAEHDMERLVGSGYSSLAAARALIGRYFQKAHQSIIVATILGCIASNKANNSGDNVKVFTASTFSYDNFVDTILLAGEEMSNFGAIIIHPTVKGQIMKADKSSIQTVKDSALGDVEYYNNLEIISASDLPIVVDATNGNRYTSVIIRKGAFVYAPGKVDYPVEEVRNGLKGNGGGKSAVVFRTAFLLAPQGWSYNKAAQVGEAPTVAELQNPANWTRMVAAKQAPFLAMETKVA